MKLPTPDENRSLTQILPTWQEALDYAALAALESAFDGNLAYDSHEDIVIYHYTVKDLDREILPVLAGTEEIWIITGAGVES